MKFTDVMACVSSALLLLLASARIPLIGPFFGLLTPLPFLYYTTKWGLYEGLKIVFLILLIVGLSGGLAGYPQILLFCLEFSLVGILISELFRRRLSLGRTLFWGTFFTLALGGTILTLVAFSHERMGPLELILRYLQSNLKETIHAYEVGGMGQEKVLVLQEYSKVLTAMIAKVYPALMITGTAFMVWILVILSRPLFHIGKLEYPDFGQTDRWQAPEHMVWGVIAAGFALFLSIAGIRLWAVNALIVMLAVYFFQGLSILLFFLNKYKVSPRLRVVLYLLFMFQQIFWVGLAMAGLFDQWIDFRKIHKRAANQPD